MADVGSKNAENTMLDKDFEKAKEILIEGLSVPKVFDRNYLEERLRDLNIAIHEQRFAKQLH